MHRLIKLIKSFMNTNLCFKLKHITFKQFKIFMIILYLYKIYFHNYLHMNQIK